MKKKLKKFLMFMLLLPILPIIGVQGDEDDEGDDDKGTEGKDEKAAKSKTFSQDELDEIVTRRLSREQKSWKKKMDDETAKAKMSEVERLKKEKEDTIKEANSVLDRANARLLKASVISTSSKLNIVDADTAFILMDKDLVEVTDDGEVKGVEKALKLLVETKPFLVKAATDDGEDETPPASMGDNQQGAKKKKSTADMNSLIRKAAGRS